MYSFVDFTGNLPVHEMSRLKIYRRCVLREFEMLFRVPPMGYAPDTLGLYVNGTFYSLLKMGRSIRDTVNGKTFMIVDGFGQALNPLDIVRSCDPDIEWSLKNVFYIKRNFYRFWLCSWRERKVILHKSKRREYLKAASGAVSGIYFTYFQQDSGGWKNKYVFRKTPVPGTRRASGYYDRTIRSSAASCFRYIQKNRCDLDEFLTTDDMIEIRHFPVIGMKKRLFEFDGRVRSRSRCWKDQKKSPRRWGESISLKSVHKREIFEEDERLRYE